MMETKRRVRIGLEIYIMVGLLAVCYAGIALIGLAGETPEGGMDGKIIFGWMSGFLLLGFGIAIVSVMSGIGGGVLFTPFMMAFTPVNSLIIRGTGMIVAMFSGLTSTRGVMRAGLANLKICVFACTAYGVGAFLGAVGAISLAERMGETGEGLVRVSLGLILLGLVIFFLFGGKKIDWPVVSHSDRLTRKLGFSLPYFEPSIGRVVDYTLHRSGWFFISVIGVGLVGGFFGMGAGWAIVPAQNLVLGLPLKVAAANSGALLGMGNCIAVWPYIHSGAIIPLFVAPWLVGHVLGGLIGTRLLIAVQSGLVRLLLIGFMGFSAYGLLTRGLTSLGLLPSVPVWVTGGAFLLIFTAVIVAVVRGSNSPPMETP